MKHEEINAVEVCKELEDILAPRLKLSVLDRAVYSHLLRHSLFEGKPRLRFSILWLAHNLGITARRTHESVRRLVDKQVLRLVERSNIGHVVEVRLPGEVPAARDSRTGIGGRAKLQSEVNLDELDFMRTPALRRSIHARERGVCFYCLRRTPRRAHCLDHAVPLAQSGSNSYRNLVSSCLNCNSRKSDVPAADFLRQLFREGRLSATELSARLPALQALAAGKLQPQVFTGGNTASDAGTKNKGAREGAAPARAEAQGLHRPAIL
ncbi:MAG TPA: HNH endonuclease signature motif containing protein [Candidatus Acidoferrum sp.]|nr:HNH endonuclease signature motif containing protein [Candidatus Acidoferrum sp.]